METNLYEESRYATAAMHLMSNYCHHLLSLDAHIDSRTDSQALPAEYCIVGIPHNTAIYYDV